MGGKSTTTQENKPPSWAEGLFKQSASEASNLYNSGSGGNTYLGNTVAPLSGTTMQGVNQLANAGQNWNTAGTRPLYQQLGAASVSDPFVNRLANVAGGVQGGTTNTSGIQGGQTNVSGITGGQTNTAGITGGQTDTSGINAQNVSAGDFQGILDRAQQPTSAASNLQGYASGDYLKGEGNPFYRQRLEEDITKANDLIRSSMSGAGRYGSGVSNETIGDNTRRMLLEGLETDFNRQTQNQFNAVGMIDAANQGALGTQMGAASGIAGINTGNADRGLQAGISRAGFNAADLDRGLQAATTRAGFGAADLDRGLTAATSRAGFGAADLDRGLQAATSRAGFNAADLDRGLTAAGLQGNLLSQAGNLRGQGLDRGMTATNAMAGMDQKQFENRLAGAGATLQAGNILDNQSQKQIQDKVNKFYSLDNQDWTRLGMLQSAAAGAAGPYGSQLAQQRTSPGMGSVLGAGASMFGGK